MTLCPIEAHLLVVLMVSAFGSGCAGSDSKASSDGQGGKGGGTVDCRSDGDGKTTLVFVNRCAEAVTYRGSDIPGGVIEPGGRACVDIGSDVEPLSSKRYWGWTGEDPGASRHTLAEFTFNTDFNDFDWYNISHVDAHNIPMQLVPVARPDCVTLTCSENWLSSCPAEGRYTDASGKVISCVSPERDDGQSPVALFFEACDDAYAWSADDQNGDDPSPMRACAAEDFDIVFCPEKGEPETGELPADGDALGAYPVEPSLVTRGGTMTFTNVGAPGWWPRRLERETGDPACDYKDGTDTWGGHCCQARHETTSDTLSPFDEEMTLILKTIHAKQLAVYQPQNDTAAADWARVTAWDERTGVGQNLWFTQNGEGSASFPGDLQKNDCVGYLMQDSLFDCGDGQDYYCPDDPGILHRGFSGSKLIALLVSMDVDDGAVTACDSSGAGHPGPWIALVASELVRDGGRKWNGLCNCYSKTGSVGDGCGEINVFEVVMDDNEYSNREFASTGVRSYQEGHVGGAVCMTDCDRDAIAPTDVEVVDACNQTAYAKGPEVVLGGTTDGCPVWRRPEGDRYLFILLDESTRTIQLGLIHPDAIPAAASPLLPTFPGSLARDAIEGMIGLRLPG